jgi:hypothetical protein
MTIDGEKAAVAAETTPAASAMAPVSESDETEIGKPETVTPPAEEYIHGFRLVVLAVSLMLGMFLVALDNVGYISNTRSSADYLDHSRHRHPKNHR